MTRMKTPDQHAEIKARHSLERMVGRPVEFQVKSSEWKKMPAKTKAALVEMVKCAAKMVQGPKCPRCASYRVQQIGIKRWHCCSCQKRWSVRTPNDQALPPGDTK